MLTKLILKIVLTTAITGGIISYGMYLVTGQHPFQNMHFSTGEFSLDKVSKKLDKISDNIPGQELDISLPKDIGEKQTVYKWVDKNGVTRYSSEAPTDGSSADSLELDPNTNIVQALTIPQQEPPASRQQNVAPGSQTLISPNAEKLINDAKDVQKMLNERAKQ